MTIPKSLWLAYAGAGAATALCGATTAEAEIHYSGGVNVTFLGEENKYVAFPLDQPGDSIAFFHSYSNSIIAGNAFFAINGLKSGSFIGYLSNGFSAAQVSQLTNRAQNVSQGHFLTNYPVGTLAGEINHFVRGPWQEGGLGFVGFRFNHGAGRQYGWARVRMRDADGNFAFKVLDYAYADPGEPIKVGQRSSSLPGAPDKGSIGLLALGATGLRLFRRRRKDAPV